MAGQAEALLQLCQDLVRTEPQVGQHDQAGAFGGTRAQGPQLLKVLPSREEEREAPVRAGADVVGDRLRPVRSSKLSANGARTATLNQEECGMMSQNETYRLLSSMETHRA